MIFRHVAVGLDQAFLAEDLGDAHDAAGLGGALSGRLDCLVRKQRGIKQAVGIVEGRPKKLAARQILVGRRDAAFDRHISCVERLRIAETRQRCAVGTQQEDRLDHVTARLADGECCERAVEKRSLGHDAVDGERQLRHDLFDADRR